MKLFFILNATNRLKRPLRRELLLLKHFISYHRMDLLKCIYAHIITFLLCSSRQQNLLYASFFFFFFSFLGAIVFGGETRFAKKPKNLIKTTFILDLKLIFVNTLLVRTVRFEFVFVCHTLSFVSLRLVRFFDVFKRGLLCSPRLTEKLVIL